MPGEMFCTALSAPPAVRARPWIRWKIGVFSVQTKTASPPVSTATWGWLASSPAGDSVRPG